MYKGKRSNEKMFETKKKTRRKMKTVEKFEVEEE